MKKIFIILLFISSFSYSQKIDSSTIRRYQNEIRLKDREIKSLRTKNLIVWAGALIVAIFVIKENRK